MEATLQRVVGAVARLPGFVALSLGGSISANMADAASDVDIHVYWREPLATPDERAAQLNSIADPGSVTVNILTWGLEDHLAVDGRLVELIYVHLGDLQQQIERAYTHGLISEGFTTAQLYYVANGRPLHDPEGALQSLRKRLTSDFPDATRRLLLQHHPALLHVYLRHLRLAQSRGDLLFVQHRRYTLQMVYFDLLFALNRRYHPGEKRLLAHAAGCPLRPDDFHERWAHAARLPPDDPALAGVFQQLIDDLEHLIEEHR